MKNISIAIDGPAGAGKSSIAKAVAEKLGILYIDTGAMYRAVTLSIIRNHINLEDMESIKCLIEKIDIYIENNKIYLNGEDVTEEIRTQEVNKLVSPVSAVNCIRKKLVELQRKMASKDSVIMDGRDIGTNVLIDADIKIFLTASVDERARRRYTELKEKGYEVDYESIKQDIYIRDKRDSSRAVNPLKKAEDALLIDTTYISIEDVIDEILNIVKER